jgi:hypothetical protein
MTSAFDQFAAADAANFAASELGRGPSPASARKSLLSASCRRDPRPHAAGECGKPLNACAREAAQGAARAKGRRDRAILACCLPRVP